MPYSRIIESIDVELQTIAVGVAGDGAAALLRSVDDGCDHELMDAFLETARPLLEARSILTEAIALDGYVPIVYQPHKLNSSAILTI